MRLFNAKVFDDVISGTTATWLTASELDDVIGQADALAVQVVTEGVGGTGPTVAAVVIEHSSDGQNWIVAASAFGIALPMQEGASFWGGDSASLGMHKGAKGRLRISLGGTSPTCRLKLYVTGRTYPY